MSDVRGQKKMDVTVQPKRVNLPFPPSFCPVQASNGLDDALPHPVRAIFFTAYQLKC